MVHKGGGVANRGQSINARALSPGNCYSSGLVCRLRAIQSARSCFLRSRSATYACVASGYVGISSTYHPPQQVLGVTGLPSRKHAACCSLKFAAAYAANPLVHVSPYPMDRGNPSIMIASRPVLSTQSTASISSTLSGWRPCQSLGVNCMPSASITVIHPTSGWSTM